MCEGADKAEKDFFLYLNDSGVMDLVVNAVTFIHKEHDKPQNVTEYVKKRIIAASFDPDAQKLNQLTKKIAELHAAVDKAQESNRKLKATLGLDPSPSYGTSSPVSDSSPVSLSPVAEVRTKGRNVSGPVESAHPVKTASKGKKKK